MGSVPLSILPWQVALIIKSASIPSWTRLWKRQHELRSPPQVKKDESRAKNKTKNDCKTTSRIHSDRRKRKDLNTRDPIYSYSSIMVVVHLKDSDKAIPWPAVLHIRPRRSIVLRFVRQEVDDQRNLYPGAPTCAYSAGVADGAFAGSVPCEEERGFDEAVLT